MWLAQGQCLGEVPIPTCMDTTKNQEHYNKTDRPISMLMSALARCTSVLFIKKGEGFQDLSLLVYMCRDMCLTRDCGFGTVEFTNREEVCSPEEVMQTSSPVFACEVLQGITTCLDRLCSRHIMLSLYKVAF